jgi:hypothetical protein
MNKMNSVLFVFAVGTVMVGNAMNPENMGEMQLQINRWSDLLRKNDIFAFKTSESAAGREISRTWANIIQEAKNKAPKDMQALFGALYKLQSDVFSLTAQMSLQKELADENHASLIKMRNNAKNNLSPLLKNIEQLIKKAEKPGFGQRVKGFFKKSDDKSQFLLQEFAKMLFNLLSQKVDQITKA